MIWFLVAVVFIAAAGWATWLSRASAVDAPLLLPLTLAVAIAPGALSQVMLWLGLLRIPITATSATIAYLLLMAPGWYLLVSARKFEVGAQRAASLHLKPAEWGALLLLTGISGAILFNAVYLPFYRADTLGIYVPFAVEIADTSALAPITPQRNLYELYPQQLSMNYAFVFMADAWPNPYPARLIATLLSLGVLPAVFMLARSVQSTAAAWVTVLLVALMPDYGNWASSGYVDLPMAFYYALCALFTWAALHHGRTADVFLAALSIGLAAWVKNAALPGILLFFTILLPGLTRRKLSLKQALLAFVTVAIVTLPWYARNLVLAGALTPDTVWADDAQQTLSELFVLVTRPQNYGLPGIVMLAGIFWGGWQLFRTQHRGVFFVLWWSVPYYVLWLLFASYDPRFLLLFLPFFAVLGGLLCMDLWQHVGSRRQPILAVMMAVAALLAVQVMWGSVEYKRDIAQNPFMTHEEKLDVIANRE